MLALGIRYLNGFAAAAQPADYDRAEWPPHPGRVFMALAAAHFETGADPEERHALLWLEGLDAAPAMSAPEAVERAVVTHYVPVNDKPGPSKAILQSVPLTRDRQPRTFARVWLDHDTVFLVWPDAEAKEPIRAALQALCAKVTRIGHSSSLVQMWLAAPDEIAGPNWLPDEERAVIRLRVATPGTLEDLARRYNADTVETFAALKAAEADASDKKAQGTAKKRLKEEFSEGPPRQIRPQLSFSQGYARPVPPSAQAITAPGTVFSPHVLVFKVEPEAAPYRHLDLPSMLVLTQRWREALCSQSNDLSDTVRSILSGHDASSAVLEGPHLAFLPLAFVGHEHADGRLLGAALALPCGLARDDRRGVLIVVGRVRRLVLGRMGTWRVEPETSMHRAWNLRPEAWTAHPEGSTHWSSVTPVVYDQHPKTKDRFAYQEEVANMIRRACTRIALPEPREVIVTPVSAHLGAPPAHAFPRLRRKDNSQRRHTHAILVFDQAVRGPVLLGAGRYRGYGLCRPLSEAGPRRGNA
jgi:CRISPR-associated protein Csb2